MRRLAKRLVSAPGRKLLIKYGNSRLGFSICSIDYKPASVAILMGIGRNSQTSLEK
jgi:hypothetical protein